MAQRSSSPKREPGERAPVRTRFELPVWLCVVLIVALSILLTDWSPSGESSSDARTASVSGNPER